MTEQEGKLPLPNEIKTKIFEFCPSDAKSLATLRCLDPHCNKNFMKEREALLEEGRDGIFRHARKVCNDPNTLLPLSAAATKVIDALQQDHYDTPKFDHASRKARRDAANHKLTWDQDVKPWLNQWVTRYNLAQDQQVESLSDLRLRTRLFVLEKTIRNTFDQHSPRREHINEVIAKALADPKSKRKLDAYGLDPHDFMNQEAMSDRLKYDLTRALQARGTALEGVMRNFAGSDSRPGRR